MIQISPQSSIYVYLPPADFRKGIDGLCGICSEELGHDPFSGAVFVFTNRKRTALKILIYDGQGFWICHKRLSEGKLYFWPRGEGSELKLLASELQVLIWNGDYESACLQAEFRSAKS